MTNMSAANQNRELHTLQAIVQQDWSLLPLPIVHRVHRCELPIAQWIYDQQQSSSQALMVGINGPQGSGKSTTSACLKVLLEHYFGLRVLAISIDDFYLTKVERNYLAQHIHPLLATRGVPGTHDVHFAMELLSALKQQRTRKQFWLPQFNKAADDRHEQSQWLLCQAPVDVILFEGWCVGAQPEPEGKLATPINQLESSEDANSVWRRYVNDALAGPYQKLFNLLDKTILLRYGDFSWVADWRKQQEKETAAMAQQKGLSTLGIMSDAEIDRFVLFYERVTRHCQNLLPGQADVVIDLLKDRSVQSMEWKDSHAN